MGSLFASLGLSRNAIDGLPQLVKDDGAESIGACPLEGPMLYSVDKAALNARAMEILKESTATSTRAMDAAATNDAASLGTQVPAANPTDAAKAVSNAVSDWVSAWKATDTAGYLASYSPGFQPSGKLSREEWEAQRRSVLSRSKEVDVRISDLRVEVLDTRHAVSKFLQAYRSQSYSDVVQKTLEWESVNGKWQITREFSQAVDTAGTAK
jgi:outer membrane protein, adhesin transport system